MVYVRAHVRYNHKDSVINQSVRDTIQCTVI